VLDNLPRSSLRITTWKLIRFVNQHGERPLKHFKKPRASTIGFTETVWFAQIFKKLRIDLNTEVFDLAKNKGKKYECVKCGAVVVYASDCSCTVCDIVCCGTPMKPKK